MSLLETLQKYADQEFTKLRQIAPKTKEIVKAIKKEDEEKSDSKHLLKLDSYPAYFIIGRRGEGKSVLLEWMEEYYYNHDYVILDWNCAFDLESLQWCVEDWERKEKGLPTKAYPILIIIPRTVWFKTDGRMIEHPKFPGRMVEAIKFVYDDTPLHKIIMQAYDEQRICVFSIYLYPTIAEGQRKISQFLSATPHGLPMAIRDHLPTHIKCVLGFRELKDLSSKGMNTHEGDGQKSSKRGLNFISAQARHARTILIADMQNTNQVQGAMFEQEDYVFIKRMIRRHIPKWLQWLDKEIRAKLKWASNHYMLHRVGIVNIDWLNKNSFICLHPTEKYTTEHNSQPLFRHHQENDDAQKLAGILEKGRMSQEEAKQDLAIQAEEQRKKAEQEKETISKLQECLIMHELEGYDWPEIQSLKKVKDDKGNQLDPGALGRKVNRYWKKYKRISLPKDDNRQAETSPN